MRSGDIPRALALYDQARANGLDSAELHNNRGVALHAAENDALAVAAYEQAIERNPGFAQAWLNLGSARRGLGDLGGALTAIRRAVEIEPAWADAHTHLLFLQNYRAEIAPEAAKADALSFSRMAAGGVRSLERHHNDPDPDRRLKVGLVSADFHEHPVARFLLPLLRASDVNRVRFHAYSNGNRPDRTTDQLRVAIPDWTDITALNDEAVAQRIVDDCIDVLFDLSGHTDRNRHTAS